MTNFQKLRALIYLGILSVFLISCNDQGELGQEVIEAENFEIFTQEFPFEARTLSTDSILTEGLVDYFLIGRTEDPVFGTFEASFYTQFSLLGFDQNFEGATLDSVFLELQYDTFTYGNLAADFDFYVHRLLELPDPEIQKFSDEVLNIDPTPMGALEDFIPENYVIDTSGEKQLAILRIPLDQAFGEELLSYDSLVFSANDNFQDRFNGLYLTGSDENKGMISFNLFDTDSKLVLYYKNANGEQREFDFAVSGPDFRLPVFQKDQSSAEVSSYLNDFERGKKYLFLSGLSGNYIELNLEAVGEALQDKIINSVEICFPYDDMAFSNYDYELFPELNVVSLQYIDDDGDFKGIRDQSLFYYSNVLKTDKDSIGQEFCLKITAQVQSMSKGEISDRILIFPVLPQNNPKKIILNGLEATERKASLNVIYSEPI